MSSDGSAQAQKYYPADADLQKKKTRKTIRPTTYRKSLVPGTVLIALAGRYRGKRVVLLKNLDQGVILVSGPFKVNGVPIRRMNARYVIATSTKIDIESIPSDVLDKISKTEYWAREKDSKKKGEEAFFQQGEKPQKKETDKGRVEDQKTVDKPLLEAIKKTEGLSAYLASSFSLRKGQKPHAMVF